MFAFTHLIMSDQKLVQFKANVIFFLHIHLVFDIGEDIYDVLNNLLFVLFLLFLFLLLLWLLCILSCFLLIPCQEFEGLVIAKKTFDSMVYLQSPVFQGNIVLKFWNSFEIISCHFGEMMNFLNIWRRFYCNWNRIFRKRIILH